MTDPNTGETAGDDQVTDEVEDEGLVDPTTGQPFPDTPEGRAAKKTFLTERRNARHPHGGPPGQTRKADRDNDR